ncbi:hypothetical protein [Catenuloplanes japonicus]|uniref:hypothetical protein n=1 Tax=Catenuloplanes japonicus TaxID=33876 RepID=UPI000525E9BB|nr:hypothetical protein [Catenuloplanes japonicus]
MSSHDSYINPESVFAQTALEMVASHGPEDASSDDMMCDRCQQPLPCPPVRNAILVLEGAGLPVHPAGSAEARRAAAESALGHAMPPSGAKPPSSPLTEPLPGPLAGTAADLLGSPADLPIPDAAPSAEAAPAAEAPDDGEKVGAGAPDGPPRWPDPTASRAVA